MSKKFLKCEKKFLANDNFIIVYTVEIVNSRVSGPLCASNVMKCYSIFGTRVNCIVMSACQSPTIHPTLPLPHTWRVHFICCYSAGMWLSHALYNSVLAFYGHRPCCYCNPVFVGLIDVCAGHLNVVVMLISHHYIAGRHRVAHGLDSSMDWIGLGHNFEERMWIRLDWVRSPKNHF